METKIIRDKRRKRTLAINLTPEVLTIYAPLRMSERRLHEQVDSIVRRIEKEKEKRINNLNPRTEKLNHQYFQGRLKWQSISFSKRQKQRYGSCSTLQGTIRLSEHLLTVPYWVLDYVIIHELAHLLENNHSKKFWELVYRYPHTERARGYLLALHTRLE